MLNRHCVRMFHVGPLYIKGNQPNPLLIATRSQGMLVWLFSSGILSLVQGIEANMTTYFPVQIYRQNKNRDKSSTRNMNADLIWNDTFVAPKR
jgi:hypothetical protein